MDNDLKEKIKKEILFLSDHWTEDERKPFNFGGWLGEVVHDITAICESYTESKYREKYELIKIFKWTTTLPDEDGSTMEIEAVPLKMIGDVLLGNLNTKEKGE